MQNPPVRSKKRSPEETKGLLLDAAQVVFSRNGYTAARLEDIAIEAGLTRGSISWYYKNKLSLFKAVMYRTFNKGIKDVNYILTSDDPPLKKLENVIDYLLNDRFHKHQEVIIFNNLLIEKPKNLESTIKLVEELFETMFSTHAHVIQKGIDAGVIDNCISPDLCARSLYNYFWGFFTNYNWFYKNVDIEALREHIKDMFLYSIKKQLV